ncbi:MAG: inverse autotransporter beta domain-containing protein, partial [Planctomycetaceae bacterium]|nr:inverse autotransporter beta domain-containing protein [Planctomycetaceae bacterium]
MAGPLPESAIAQDDGYITYRPYLEIGGRAGGAAEVGQGTLFVPLYQTNEDLFFADLRGLTSDQQTVEGNWGLGFRKMIDQSYIVGGYAFYDLRRSHYNNNYEQATIGLELLTVDYDFRINGYIPGNTGPMTAAPLSTATVSNGSIVVNGGFERAYYGSDFEVGMLLAEWDEGLEELRGYIGGYAFDNDAPGFESMIGPRARVELRIYELDMLGADSRVVLGGEYQYDQVRGSQASAMASVRVAFGPGGQGRWLNRLHRRMLNPIVRDIDVVTNAITSPVAEAAKFSNGTPIGTVGVINALTVDPETVLTDLGDNSIAIFDGSEGTITQQIDTFQMNNGQFVIGGGSSIQVVSCDTGSVATLTVPGIRPL